MKNKMSQIFLASLVGLALLSTFYYIYGRSKNDEIPITPNVTVTATPTSTILVETPTPTEVIIINEGAIPKGYTHFVEAYPKIGGEQGYVAVPKEVNEDTLPPLVMYYHGSGQKITTNFNDQIMKNMRAYGAYFTERNMVFMASNQHGDNWGSKTAVEDSRALIAWGEKKYKISESLYVVGFSMGGMPALKHVILYPKEVTRIALLAPAQQAKTYTKQQIQYFRQVGLKVWHGTADVNVPYWVTTELKSYFDKYDTPITVVTLKGKTHWDVDTEYMKDIYEWFYYQ